MKMKTLNLYRVLRTRILLKVFIMTAVALHFGSGGWNERLFYSTAPKHKSIGTTSPFFREQTMISEGVVFLAE